MKIWPNGFQLFQEYLNHHGRSLIVLQVGQHVLEEIKPLSKGCLNINAIASDTVGVDGFESRLVEILVDRVDIVDVKCQFNTTVTVLRGFEEIEVKPSGAVVKVEDFR